jgi:large subunit ribosomal protein L29
MKTSEMRDKTVEELKANEGDLRREMFNLRFQVVTGEIQNPRRIRQARREIARLKTVAAEKARQEAKEQMAKQKGAEPSKEEGTK